MDLFTTAFTSWQEIEPICEDAIVFVDEPFSMSIRWSCLQGFKKLFDISRAVIVFPTAGQEDAGQQKSVATYVERMASGLTRISKKNKSQDEYSLEKRHVVFLLSTHLSRMADTIRETIMSLVSEAPSNCYYTQCSVVTTLSEDLHVFEASRDESLVGVWSADSPSELNAQVTASLWDTHELQQHQETKTEFSSYHECVETNLRRLLVNASMQHANHTSPNSQMPFNMQFSVNIRHVPFCFALVTNSLFLIPGFTDCFPSLSVNQASASNASGTREDGSVNSRTSVVSNADTASQAKLRALACNLTTLLDSLDLKDDLFALGKTSKQLSRMIIGQSTRSKRHTNQTPSSNSRRVAVILVDRTMDLVSPLMHSDNLLDRIWSVLPRLTRARRVEKASRASRAASSSPISSVNNHSIDLCVPATYVCPTNPQVVQSHGLNLSFAHGLDEECLDILNSLCAIGYKQGLITVRKRLVDLIQREMPDKKQSKILGKLTHSQLADFMSLFSDKSLMHLWIKKAFILQMFSAVLESSKPICELKYDQMMNIEKVLLMTVGEAFSTYSDTPNQSVVPCIHQLRDLLLKITQEKQQQSQGSNESLNTQSQNSGLTTRDVLILIVMLYSLLGDSVVVSHEYEKLLQEALYRAMISASPKANARAIQAWIKRTFVQFKLVSEARCELRTYRDLVVAYQPFVPLLERIGYELAGRTNEELDGNEYQGQFRGKSDLAHVPYGGTLGSVMGGITSFFKRTAVGSNLVGSWIGGSDSNERYSSNSSDTYKAEVTADGSSIQPSDFENVIVFVVGGISFHEVGKLKKAILRDSSVTGLDDSGSGTFSVHRGGKVTEVLVGSTDIATKETIMNFVLNIKK